MNEAELITPMPVTPIATSEVVTYSGRDITSARIEEWRQAFRADCASPSHDQRWLMALTDGLGQRPYCLVANKASSITGVAPLMFVKSRLFGRFLVSLPYLNSSGLRVKDEASARLLVDEAVRLADELDVRYLELRHEECHEHPRLTENVTSKVHMRLNLPSTSDELWDGLKAKVRNQIRKARKYEMEILWGTQDLLADFYSVFSTNMRDLGSPVFGQSLFSSILRHFPGDAEFCVIRHGGKPVAAALLVHGEMMTEVPSASSLRSHNSMNPNMLMYWSLLERAVERGQQVFDFGRSSKDSNTFKFKKQWGAEPSPAVWQYYLRKGEARDMRPESGRFDRLISMWKRLPVPVTRLLGPHIVRGIP